MPCSSLYGGNLAALAVIRGLLSPTPHLRIARRLKDHRHTPIPASLASDERAISYRRLTAFINWKYLERKAKKGSGEARRLTDEESHRERPNSYPCPD
jgi:hypothetical protein